MIKDKSIFIKNIWAPLKTCPFVNQKAFSLLEKPVLTKFCVKNMCRCAIYLVVSLKRAHLSPAGLWPFQEFVSTNVVDKVSHANVKLSADAADATEINSAHAVGHEAKYMLHAYSDF